MSMGQVSERIKELERELRHAKKRNHDIQERVLKLERENADLREGAEGICMMMDAHLAAAAVTYGESTEKGKYRIRYPFELVTDGLYKYTVDAQRENGDYIVDVTQKELWAE